MLNESRSGEISEGEFVIFVAGYFMCLLSQPLALILVPTPSPNPGCDPIPGVTLTLTPTPTLTPILTLIYNINLPSPGPSPSGHGSNQRIVVHAELEMAEGTTITHAAQEGMNIMRAHRRFECSEGVRRCIRRPGVRVQGTLRVCPESDLNPNPKLTNPNPDPNPNPNQPR